MKTKISALILLLFLVLSCTQKSVTSPTESAANKNWQINLNQPPTNEDAGRIVTELLKNSKVIAKEYFCVKNDLVCRVHYTLGKPNGELVDPFYIAFVAAH